MFKGLGLQAKIISISLLIALLVIVLIGSIQAYNSVISSEKIAKREAQKFIALVDQKMQKKLDIGITGAITMAANRELLEAVENGDKKQAQTILAGINENFRKNTNYKGVKVHIHTPDNHSFLRNWNNKNGDDLSSFRYGVEEVIKNKKPIQVLELGRAGLAIRGIAPLFYHNKYLGSLEFIQGVSSVHREFKKQNAFYLMLLNDEALKISTKAKNYPKVNDYVLASDKWFGEDAVKFAQTIDWSMLKQKGWIIENNKLITIAPIKDMRGLEVGLQFIAEPLDGYNAEINEMITNMIKQGVIISIIVIVMLLSMLVIIRSAVIGPVKSLQSLFNAVASNGDFSLRAKTDDSKNEVNLMARDFNGLMSNLQDIIESISKTMSKIEKGNLNARVETHAVGDLETLKNTVNQTANVLDKTMTEISRVLGEMKLANFSVEITDTQAQGAFKEAINSMEQTIQSLKMAVSEINQSANAMLHANFSHPVKANLSGDLGKLKDNLNSALDSLDSGFNGFTNSLTQLSSGDLSATVDGEYEGQLANLQDIINNSLANIASMFTEIKFSSERALENVSSVSQGNQDLNDRTQNQAASIEETAAATEEITSTVQNSLQNAQEANSLAQQAREEANQGAKVMSQAKEAMESIREASQKINEITSMIDSIAFQTNLLALNAAVEAARAGEHGRGFAVVAGEVRSLAQKAADAAKDISVLVEDTAQKINQGSELAEKSSEMLEKINQRIASVSDMVEEITRSSGEQSEGMSQINQAITSMDQITQQNAALVEEVTASTETATEMVSQLVKLANSFKIDTEKLSLTTTLQTGNFDFAQARRTHRNWRSHMSGLIHAGFANISEAEVAETHECGLGQWIDNHSHYAHLPEFQNVVSIHNKLHDQLHHDWEEVKKTGQELDLNEAHQIEELSNQLIDAINILEKAAATKQLT